MSQIEGQVENVAKEVQGAAKEASKNPLVDRMARAGFIMRGFIYSLTGVIAIQVIVRARYDMPDRQGILAEIAARPLGGIILVAIAVGVLGMMLWGVIRALADPMKKGNGFQGVVTRLGYAFTGFIYGGMLIPILNLLTRAGIPQKGETERAQDVAAGILTYSWGPYVVGAVGVGLMVIGLLQIYRGLSTRFRDWYRVGDVDPARKYLALTLGRIGYVAHGVVVSILGVMALLAAYKTDPNQVGGMDRALLYLASQTYGAWLLAAAALGFIAYGIYSFLIAIWFDIRRV
jgi:hypothetical protein